MRGVWAYSLISLPGQMWVHGLTGEGAEGRIAINRSLGGVVSKGWLAPRSDDAVDAVLRPHLGVVLQSPVEADIDLVQA